MALSALRMAILLVERKAYAAPAVADQAHVLETAVSGTAVIRVDRCVRDGDSEDEHTDRHAR